ncbi:hypothetical protein, partial [Treponema sp. R80B11-R83G3]
LGMKSILINEDNVFTIHDLKELYYKMPEAFRKKFESTTYPKKTIEKSLEEIKNIFIDFRYMNTDHLGFFVDKIIFTTDYKIDFSQVKRLQNFQFITILLYEIQVFYNYIVKKVDKAFLDNFGKKQFTLKPDNTELCESIKKYNEELKKVQISTHVTRRI